MYRVIIDCERNDWDDIRIGGPMWLGFDFVVKDDIDKAELRQFLEEKLKQYGRPIVSIEMFDLSEPKTWTKEMMEECIKRGYD